MDLPGRPKIDVRIGQHIRKIEKSGYCFCTLCKREVKYDTEGVGAITKHIKKAKKHIAGLKTVLTTRKGCFTNPSGIDESSTYGLDPLLVETVTTRDEEVASQLPSYNQRKSQM